MQKAVSSLLSILLYCLTSGLIAAEASETDLKPLIVSTQGVTAFNSETLQPSWRALIGETTHAPVIAAGLAIVSTSVQAYMRLSLKQG